MIELLLCAIRDGINKLIESINSTDSTTNTLLGDILNALNANNIPVMGADAKEIINILIDSGLLEPIPDVAGKTQYYGIPVNKIP